MIDCALHRREFVHLAYLDDSDTKAKSTRWQVMSAVIIGDDVFKMAEIGISALPEKLMAEQLDKFQEFHAAELYGGYGAFEGIDQERRFDAIRFLLALLPTMGISVVYGAVNLDVLKNEVYGSADPVDICFRKCLLEIKAWADAKLNEEVDKQLGENIWDTEKMTQVMLPGLLNQLIILIVDECDGKTKKTLQESFRSLRPRAHSETLLQCFHDDMYFGDSRFSIGIQLADLCSYFIARHLQGDHEIDSFYQMIEPRIYSKQEPNDGKAKSRPSDEENPLSLEGGVAAQDRSREAV